MGPVPRRWSDLALRYAACGTFSSFCRLIHVPAVVWSAIKDETWDEETSFSLFSFFSEYGMCASKSVKRWHKWHSFLKKPYSEFFPPSFFFFFF